MKRITIPLLTVALLVAESLLLPVTSAFASQLAGPPAADGSYMHCNYSQDQNTGSGQIHWRLRCQYGKVGGNVSTSNVLSIGIRWCNNSACTAPVFPGYNTWNYQSGDLAGQIRSPDAATTSGSGNPGVLHHVECGQFNSGANNPGWTSASYTDGTCLIGTSSLSGSADSATVPTDFWPGGSAGPALDVVSPVSTCSITRKSAGNGTWYVVLAGGDSASATGAVDTYSWAFGDSSSSTSQNPDHNYSGAGPYTATITVTRNVASGHLFTDGTSTARTSTCSKSVSWSAGTSSTTTTSIPGDSGTGSSDCDFWDVGCWVVKGFRDLFLPSQDTRDGIGDLWGDLTSKAPFSIVYEVVTYIPQQFTDMGQAIEDGDTSASNTGVCTPSPYVNPTNVYDDPANLCEANHSQLQVPGFNHATQTFDSSESGSAFSLMREIFLWGLAILIAYATYRGIGEAIK